MTNKYLSNEDGKGFFYIDPLYPSEVRERLCALDRRGKLPYISNAIFLNHLRRLIGAKNAEKFLKNYALYGSAPIAGEDFAYRALKIINEPKSRRL